MDEIKKNGNGTKWQLLRDFLLGGTFLFCVTTLWQTSSFVTKVNDFMEAQKLEWTKMDVRVKIVENNVQTLVEWKVAKTGKPFREDKVDP